MHFSQLLALALLAQPALAQAILTVDDDGGPGVDFTGLQDAIDAAPAGTLILVRDGLYDPFQIQAKSVDLVAASPAPNVLIQGISTVSDLGPDGHVHLSGLEFNGKSSDLLTLLGSPLELSGCAGPVFIDRCALRPDQDLFGLFLDPSQGGLDVELCDRVVISSSTLGASTGGVSKYGVSLLSSTAAIFECDIFGGRQIWSSPFDGTAGIDATASRLSLAGGQVSGGIGQDQAFVDVLSGCTFAGDGGPALELQFASTADVLGTVLTGGAGGSASTDPFCSPSTGEDGPPIATSFNSSSSEVPGQLARRQAFASPLAAGVPVAVDLAGAPLDNAWMLVSSRADLRFSPLTFDATPAAVSESLLIAYLGQLDAGGTLQAPIATPGLPAGLGLLFVTQPAFADTSGSLVLGNPLTIALLGPGL